MGVENLFPLFIKGNNGGVVVVAMCNGRGKIKISGAQFIIRTNNTCY